jgi:hypothetical protein
VSKAIGVTVKSCDNPECKWKTAERFIAISRLIVDSRGSIFIMPTFVCECGFHLRTEVVRT